MAALGCKSKQEASKKQEAKQNKQEEESYNMGGVVEPDIRNK